MALGGKVHHHIRLLCFENIIDRIPIRNIHPDKFKLRVLHHTLKGLEISCIGQLVQTQQLIIWVGLAHVKNKVASYKPGAAGN
ncbi:hypothetical protein SDC9_156356 [bioreactor metagenome]|uniref:Uncharacterized protein n=1 Tax=bioreactor metagenome TaxID=1076179 RepID=A0A645F3Z2_9ZZZZ